jgi:hypothetical protein
MANLLRKSLPDTDDTYNNFKSAAKTVVVDSGNFTWDVNGNYDMIVDLDGASTGKGFRVDADSQYFIAKNVPSGGNKLQVAFDGDVFNFQADAASQLVVSGASADLTFGARGQTLTFNQSGDESLSGSFTKTSFIGCFNELITSLGTHTDLDEGYGNFPGVSTITVDGAQSQGANLLWDMTGTRHFIVDLQNGTDPSGGDGLTYNATFKVDNGNDSVWIGRAGADGLYWSAAVEDINFSASSQIQLTSPSYINYMDADKSSGNFFQVSAGFYDFTASSGDQYFFYVIPSINQSGTAGYRGIYMNVDENGTGSGDSFLIKLDLNSAVKFSVDDEGNTLVRGNLDMYDNKPIIFGTNDRSYLSWYSTQTAHTLVWGLGDSSRTLIFAEAADVVASYDFGHGAATNPTLIGHSANQSTTEYWSLTHDQTHARFITGAGAFCVGSGTPGEATGVGSAYVTGILEVDGSAISCNAVLGAGVDFIVGANGLSTYGGMIWRSNDQNLNGTVFGTGSMSNYAIFCEYGDKGYDFGHTLQTEPTFYVHSKNQVQDEYATIVWNNFSVGGGKGAELGIKSITEELTISVGNGSGGVTTSGSLAPANSNIKGAVVRVTQAPGGGATTLDVGVTGSGNLDALIDGVSTALNTTGTSPGNNDGTQLPLVNASAATLTVTTDSDVTVSDMKVRIVVFYEQFTAPTS